MTLLWFSPNTTAAIFWAYITTVSMTAPLMGGLGVIPSNHVSYLMSQFDNKIMNK